MKLRKSLAAAVAMTIVCGAPAAVDPYQPNGFFTANAGFSDLEEAVVDGSVFDMYEDHVELESIPDNFKGAYSIPESVNGVPVTQTWALAFAGQPGLTSIHIPASITIFRNSGTFKRTPNVESFTVDENNTVYCAVDGILYSKDMKTMIALPTANLQIEYVVPDNVKIIGGYVFDGYPFESVIIPDSVVKIDSGAFCDMVNLKNVKIPSSLEIIDSFAFSDDTSLERIDIPASVEEIGRCAFYGCEMLTSITINNPECYIREDEDTLGVKGTTVIHGYSGSTAQDYAEKFGYTFESLGENPLTTTTTAVTSTTAQETTTTTTATPEQPAVSFGDPTGDGKIDAKDASFALVEYAKLSTGGESSLTDAEKSAADVNNDGKNDSKDASIILSYYAYISTNGTDSLEEFLKK